MRVRWPAAIAAGMLSVLSATPASAAGGFYGEVRPYAGAGEPFGSGFSSSSVAAGDLNGDGHADLAVADFTSAVSVLLGDGSGGFAPPVSYETGLGSAAVAVGDLDGDGAADLAVANSGAGTVSVLLNRDGSLERNADYPVGFSVLDVATADVDGDGRADLLAAVPLMRQVVVLRNVGDGRFEQVDAVDLGAGTPGAAPADVDSDGDVDLVVALDGDPTSLPVGVARVQVFLGSGDGTFIPGASVGGLGFLEGVAVADVNGDGHVDALGADVWTGAVAVLLGDGDGGFGAPIASPIGGGTYGTGAYDVTTADVDGDGRLDAIAGHGQDLVSVLLGDGEGRFAPAETHTVESGPQTVLGNDLNADGLPDIVVAGGTPNVSVLLHQGAQ